MRRSGLAGVGGKEEGPVTVPRLSGSRRNGPGVLFWRGVFA